jgi:hypothetical protein
MVMLVGALAIGGILVGAAPANAVGTSTKYCNAWLTFTGHSTTAYATTSKSNAGYCGEVGASAAYRVSGGSLLYTAVVYSDAYSTALVPSGNVGEGGRHTVTQHDTGYVGSITT